MSFLDRVINSYKFLDKNGLKTLIGLIKNHDVHWTGTHAEYEAQKGTIPDYAILHFTDDYDENVQVGVYSTEETKTGEIWIDGKPIYRKVVTASSFDSRLTVSIPNVKEVVNIIHRRNQDSRPGFWVIGDGVGDSSNLHFVYDDEDENAIVIRTVTSGTTIYNYTGIIEYTKTTDA